MRIAVSTALMKAVDKHKPVVYDAGTYPRLVLSAGLEKMATNEWDICTLPTTAAVGSGGTEGATRDITITLRLFI